MDVSTVKQHIKTGNFDAFYIFTGNENVVMNTYINRIADGSDLILTRVDSLMDAYKKLHNNSLMASKRCYVIMDDKDFQTNDKLWPDFESGKVLNGNKIIFVYTNMDKRWKFTKHFADRVVTFDYLKPDILHTYIMHDLTLSEANRSKLIEICECSYSRILLEMDKIRRCGGTPDEAFAELLKSGVIYQPPKDAVFDLVDAIMHRKKQLAFDLYDDCVRVGEASLVILANLYNTARNVLQIQTCQSSDVSKTTGLTGWQIKNAKDKVGYFSNEELADILKLIHRVDTGIKTGLIEDATSVPYVMVNIL